MGIPSGRGVEYPQCTLSWHLGDIATHDVVVQVFSSIVMVKRDMGVHLGTNWRAGSLVALWHRFAHGHHKQSFPVVVGPVVGLMRCVNALLPSLASSARVARSSGLLLLVPPTQASWTRHLLTRRRIGYTVEVWATGSDATMSTDDFHEGA
jgi:hypothetical protein